MNLPFLFSFLAVAAHESPVPSAVWALPFVTLLLAIASLPLSAKHAHWWEQHHNKLILGLGLGALVLCYYTFRGYGLRAHGSLPAVAAGVPTLLAVLERTILEDYAPFLILLFSLYTIAGGMHLRGTITPRPLVNTAILAIGTLLASFVGTTGASMILIVPLIEANRSRKYVAHTVVFFIFLVSNIGGLLTPLGDPPLFLGYLQGVPFGWTLHFWRQWAFTASLVLAIYYLWDRVVFRRETVVRPITREPLRLRGSINLFWLLGVVLSVAFLVPRSRLLGTQILVPNFLREGVMLGLVGLSLLTTPKGLKNESGFTYGAMIEVACLFLGIFVTMSVPIEILQVKGASLGLHTQNHFFWTCGALSSMLDNAPTYMVFFETARSMPAGGLPVLPLTSGTGEPIRVDLLEAISCSAVFMGAMTYIGNGPNLMVKSIAESRGVKMPGFFGYMLYSMGILVPVFVLVSWRFFS